MRIVTTIIVLLYSCFLSAQSVRDMKQIPQSSSRIQQQTPARMSEVNSCDTWTFQTQLASSVSEQPADAIQLPGNTYIISGNDSAASGKNGRLIKMNSSGSIVLSKTISIPANQLTIHHLRFFSNGKLFAAATAYDPLNNNFRPLLLGIDTASLAILFIRQLNIQNGPSGWKAVGLEEGYDQNLFILSNNDSLLNVTRVNTATLAVDWSKTYKPRNRPSPVGIGIDDGNVFVSWNETDSGYRKGIIMSLHQNTGDYLFGSRVGGLAAQTNVELLSMSMVGLRPRITALQWKNGIYKAIRINYEPTTTASIVEIFDVNGFTPAPGMNSRQNQWGQMLAYQHGEYALRLNLVETWPENMYSPVRSWKIDYPEPVRLNKLLLTNDGGHLLVSRTSGFPQKIILTKTDSIANLPGCGISPQPISFQFSLMPYVLDQLIAEPPHFQLAPMPFSEGDVVLNVQVDCKNLFCPEPPQPDSCLRTFFKEYRNYSNSIVSRNHVAIGNGKFLIMGSARQGPYTAVDHTQMTVIDTSGHLVDSRIMESEQVITLYTLTKLADGNLLGTGVIQNGFNASHIFLIKFDEQFSVIWQKKMTTAAAPHFNAIEAIMESSEGDLYCYLRDRITSPAETRTLLKLDATGTPVWIQQYTIGPTIFPQSNEFIPALVEVQDAIIIKYNDEASDFSPHLMRIRKSDGGLVWTRKYQMSGPFSGSSSYSLEAMVTDGKHIFLSGRSHDQNVLLKIRPDGSVAIAKKSPTWSIQLGWMGLKSNGRLMTAASMYDIGGYINGVVEMDTSFNIIRSQYMQIPKFGRNFSLMVYSDSVTYASGSLWYNNPYWATIYFQKYNFNSSFASCAVNEQLLVINDYTQPVISKNIPQASLALPQMENYNVIFSTGHLAYSGYYCGNNTSCTEINLDGTQMICDSTQVYDFTLTRNAGCNGMTLWQLDTLPGQIRVISRSDQLLQLRIRNGGSFQIKARVYASCGWLEDSLTVEATPANQSLELGVDLVLCPGNTTELQAGEGFGSYLWQDGSTGSAYTITQPGLYHVTVSSCGNLIRDTVTVLPAPPIDFNIGPDRTKCNDDTIHLNAPAGFLNYAWSNPYNISSTTSPQVIVNPMVDTTYYIMAEKTPGCFAYDTVRIMVKQSPPVQLGMDRSFCLGDSAVLNAGPAFSQYQWSTGHQTQWITVKNVGEYRLMATTSDGCKSYDTVKIISVFDLPQVNLDKNPALCAGDQKTLTAGNFVSYAWSTGAATPAITVNGVGNYWVNVTDNNGCKASDTTKISVVHPLPENFLAADTTICSYGSLELKPGETYQQYFWSTGRNTPGITITLPGTYWLDVINQNGCKGRDSIIVAPKDCMNGFFIPTAFTPNHNGKNDIYRPLLFGIVLDYEFTVYNRWGQKVFHSTQIAKGWDGSFNGLPQRSDVFVWTCTYHFEGGKKEFRKGTVVLVR